MEEDGPLPPPAGAPGAVRFGEIQRIDTKELVAAGIAAGNIFQQHADAEVMELPEVRGGPQVAGAGAAQLQLLRRTPS